jgi:hypothetical protein
MNSENQREGKRVTREEHTPQRPDPSDDNLIRAALLLESTHKESDKDWTWKEVVKGPDYRAGFGEVEPAVSR